MSTVTVIDPSWIAALVRCVKEALTRLWQELDRLAITVTLMTLC